MREILYRAKPYSDKWCYGYYAKKRDYADMEAHYIITVDDSVPWKHDFFEEHIVDPETIGQFTGKLDKHNKKIFEGDIVRTKFGRLCKVIWFESRMQAGWDLEPVNTKVNVYYTMAPDTYDLWKSENLEIVGNIHDNPEHSKGVRNVSESTND